MRGRCPLAPQGHEFLPPCVVGGGPVRLVGGKGNSPWVDRMCRTTGRDDPSHARRARIRTTNDLIVLVVRRSNGRRTFSSLETGKVLCFVFGWVRAVSAVHRYTYPPAESQAAKKGRRRGSRTDAEEATRGGRGRGPRPPSRRTQNGAVGKSKGRQGGVCRVCWDAKVWKTRRGPLRLENAPGAAYRASHPRIQLHGHGDRRLFHGELRASHPVRLGDVDLRRVRAHTARRFVQRGTEGTKAE